MNLSVLKANCYAVSPGGPKGFQAQETETITHNSVFAEHREAGCKIMSVDLVTAGPMKKIAIVP